MKRWKIVHSESSRGWGGQEHRIVAELRGFLRRDSQCWLLAPCDAAIVGRARACGINTRELRVNRIHFPFSVLGTALWLRRINPDIVNTHSSRDGWIVGLAARMAKVPLVLRSRHFHVPIATPSVSKFVYGSLADHVLTTSNQISGQLQNVVALSPEHVSTIPTGVDISEFSPEGSRASFASAGVRNDIPVIGTVSVLRLAKGHGTLLQAAALMKQSGFRARYVIVGEGPQRSSIEHHIRRLNLENEVVLCGHREDIPQVLRALDFLVIPSLSEGIPQIALQAMATKTPVIGSDAGGIPEVVRHGETGRIFPAGDATALARAIQEASRDARTTRLLAEKGRIDVEANHTVEVMLDKLEAVYCRYLRPSSMASALTQDGRSPVSHATR